MSGSTEKRVITESMNVHEEWYKRAKKMNIEELSGFIDELLNNYVHDYGTICHALSAGAMATAYAMNKAPQGGITGFQASCIMWDFIRHWNYENNKTGLKLLNFDDLLFPQNEDKFEKTITVSVWKSVQDEAKIKLEEKYREYKEYLENKVKYYADLKEFIKKYPDYTENQKKYERIGFGTFEEHEEQRKKVEAGFEFAPIEPFFFCSDNVIDHWKKIVAGEVPFGFKIVDK